MRLQYIVYCFFKKVMKGHGRSRKTLGYDVWPNKVREGYGRPWKVMRPNKVVEGHETK